MTTPKTSVILITLNEERNIRRCLSSLSFADEIIIVDSYSKDKTFEIAQTYSNVKIFQHEWLGFSAAKQLALSYTSNDWVLWIDADEEVTVDLENEIKATLLNNNDKIAFDFPRKTFFMNEWVKLWYPGKVLRLFNKNHCHFSKDIVHEKLETDGSAGIGHLHSDLHHYSYNSVHDYIQKMNTYGKYSAEEYIRRGKKFQSWKLSVNPLFTFVKMYFLNGGFLHGKIGFIISVGSSYSNFIKYLNFYYLDKERNKQKTEKQPYFAIKQKV